MKPKSTLSSKNCIYGLLILIALVIPIFSFTSSNPKPAAAVGDKDREASQKAFLKVYAVLMSPRCMNCHPSGDIPLQGEDSHLHLQGVKRGPEGRGLYALKCANCHQLKNIAGLHMPPGNPNWHLPPSDMKMIFQGKTPNQLAIQLLNPKENGHKSIKDLIRHVTSDSLVLSGWAPGEGLAKPPLSHEAFVAAFNEWIRKGAVAPDRLKH